jgi:hypothetical protein
MRRKLLGDNFSQIRLKLIQNEFSCAQSLNTCKFSRSNIGEQDILRISLFVCPAGHKH